MKVQLVLASLLLGGAGPALGQQSAQAPQARPTALQALDAQARTKIVETMAAAAEQRYVDASGGRKLADKLRQQLASGAYDALSDPKALAEALTSDMQAAVPDVHLRAVHEPNRAERALSPVMVRANASGPAPYARIDSRSTEQIAATNYGFAKVDRLAGNVGYLKLSRLVPLQLSQEAATKAMTALSGSDAVIIDLRGVPGGSPDLVVQLLSYFAGNDPVRLMTTYNRSLDQTDELWSLASVPGPRMSGVPLYVLVDKDSASAAEMLAYFVQRQKLGLVVGERTAGAGNGGNMIPVGSEISLFLPQMRIIDGPGWEGTGVMPDVPAGSSEALDVAHRAALDRIRSNRAAGTT